MWMWFFILFFGSLSLLSYADNSSLTYYYYVAEYQNLYNTSHQHHHRQLVAESVSQLLYGQVTPEKLEAILLEEKAYRERQPFPHAVLQNIFPIEVMRQVSNEIPDNPKLDQKGCVEGAKHCFIKPNPNQYKKMGFDEEEFHGPATAALFGFIKSSRFVKFLEKLSGIHDLIPDPHYRGSGIHQTLSGGSLMVHADFNLYARYPLHRRVNIILYLNENWEESYGGHLELWSRDMGSCLGRIKPEIGRMAVFSSTDFSYHGHPSPVTCPENRTRRSLALYYYTTTRPSEECLNGQCFENHSTLFQKPNCTRCEDPRCYKVTDHKWEH